MRAPAGPDSGLSGPGPGETGAAMRWVTVELRKRPVAGVDEAGALDRGVVRRRRAHRVACGGALP